MSSFCLEMAKKLGMRYKSPPLPVDLTVNNKMQGMESLINTSVVDPKLVDEVSSMFAIAK